MGAGVRTRLRLGDVGLQVIRDWVLRFNAKGPDGLIDGKATGKPRKLDDMRNARLLPGFVEDGPIPAIHGVRALAPEGLGALDIRGVWHLALRSRA